MKPICRECWDPVDRDGAELCDWCAATTQQRRWMQVRAFIVGAIALAVVAGLIIMEGIS